MTNRTIRWCDPARIATPNRTIRWCVGDVRGGAVDNAGLLVLADGTTFEGFAVGHRPESGVVAGEVVFNTALVRLPGDRHRPVVRGADHHLHLPAHRQLRRQRRRRREPPRRTAAGVIVRDLARRAVELARDRGPARLPRAPSGRRASPASTPAASPATSASAGAMPGAFGIADRDTLLAAAQADGGTDGRDLVAEVTHRRALRGRARRRGLLRGRLRLRHQALDPRPARATRAARSRWCPRRRRRPTCSPASPTACSSRTVPAIPPRSTYARDNIARAARQAAGVRHLPRPPDHVARARRVARSSCRSATTAATIRCATSRPAGSRSPARTTTTRSTPTRCPTARRVTHLNLNDGDVEGHARRATSARSACSTTPKPGPVRTTRATSSTSSPTSCGRADRCRAATTSRRSCSSAAARS